MQNTRTRVLRSLLLVALVAPALAACAAVGGGGDFGSDCDVDVSGSELTPVATAAYDADGDSCNNNEFVENDLDAYAYPASDDESNVIVVCQQESGEGASYTLFRLEGGVPVEHASGDCNGDANIEDNVDGSLYVLRIDHPAESERVSFNVDTDSIT